jgi:ABC-type nitrate/sulfonate/bicarbonate transport system substrate-binding protein
LPFTGMAVRRDWAQAHTPLAKRLLAATDKSIAWFADQAHRGEAVDLLVGAARARKDDADASYDLLRRIDYFEPSSKVSRRKLQNLIDAELKLGTIDASLAPERLVMPGVTELVE